MKLSFKVPLLVVVLMLIIFSCNEDEGDICPPFERSSSTIDILPLGDSRIEGARPTFESYRFELWKKLIEDDWDVDFIGTERDRASYPEFEGRCFDNEHEGIGGATTDFILERIRNIEFEHDPEVALLGIGVNDLLNEISINEVVENVRQIIVALRAHNAGVIVFVEQIAPGRSGFMTDEQIQSIGEFNNQIAIVADALNMQSSPIFAIDMASDWSDDFLADEVHYNLAGAREIAQRYFQAINANVEK